MTQLVGLPCDFAVSFPYYARLIGYTENSFMGISRYDQKFACREIWTKVQRDNVTLYLSEAQYMIEETLGYKLTPTWIVDELHDYSPTILAKWGNILKVGVKAEAVIENNVVVDDSTDPVTIGDISTTVTDPSEIVVYHPGTTERICPIEASISGGLLTITIPKCRMVKYELLETPSEGLDYYGDIYEETVDIARIYIDDSQQATLVWPHTCLTGSAGCHCSEYTADACIYLDKPEIGKITVHEATYSSFIWTTIHSCHQETASLVRINYLSGLNDIPTMMRNAIIRLAHANMPVEPCGCEVSQRLWLRDRNIPSILTAERIDCPFGLSDGAWWAWKYTQQQAKIGLSNLVR